VEEHPATPADGEHEGDPREVRGRVVRPPQDAAVQADSDGGVPEVDGVRGIAGRAEPFRKLEGARLLRGDDPVNEQRRRGAEDEGARHDFHAERVGHAARMAEDDAACGPDDADRNGGATPARKAAADSGRDADAQEELQNQRAGEGRGERRGVEGIVGFDGFDPDDDGGPREERQRSDAAR